jgi:hypothetical protein
LQVYFLSNHARRRIMAEKEQNVTFAKGGDTHMFSQQQAEPMKAAQTGDPGATGKGANFAKGGSGKMHGFRGSEPATAGITSAC